MLCKAEKNLLKQNNLKTHHDKIPTIVYKKQRHLLLLHPNLPQKTILPIYFVFTQAIYMLITNVKVSVSAVMEILNLSSTDSAQ